ncbi:hypothetical protein [Actinomycetospora aeridis]|uniref:Uncharacterized protein n=1 Tax=Actinomycetospora aeridis TaxID=3129231 RepID=A0ABU8NGK3_9PSEU
MTAAAPVSELDDTLVRHRRWACGVLAALGVVAGVLAALEVTGVVRAVATVTFMLLGPGWAVAGFLRGAAPALVWAVAAALGCAVGALGAVVMLRLGQWHPLAGLAALVVVVVPVLLRHAIRPR